MKKILLALALLWAGPAWAQCSGVFPNNTICGNNSGSAAPPSPITQTIITTPGSTTVGDVAIWNNTTGGALKDTPPLQIFGTQTANTFLGGPSSAGPSNPTFRALTQADIQTAFTAALAAVTLPTTQSLTSGTGATYTTPAGATWIEVFMVGGGGGGGGTSTSAAIVAGSAGGTSTFNSINAAGGSGSPTSTVPNNPGGAGGTGGTGSATRRAPGGPGGTGVTGTSSSSGGSGGASYFGSGGIGAASNGAGVAAAANSGSGGGGAANGNTPSAGSGGGAGEFVYLLIKNPAGTYTYTVGTAGNGGSNTQNGGNGGTGFIFVIEHYAP